MVAQWRTEASKRRLCEARRVGVEPEQGQRLKLNSLRLARACRSKDTRRDPLARAAVERQRIQPGQRREAAGSWLLSLAPARESSAQAGPSLRRVAWDESERPR